MKQKKGFTLVEMIIVVAIISILVSIAIPAFSSVLDRARASACLTSRRTLLSQLSLELFLTDKDSLQAVAESPQGSVWVAACRCPSKGTITVEDNAIVCSHHADQEVSIAEQERQALDNQITIATGASGWKGAIVTLVKKDPNYTFDTVSSVVLDAYAAAGGTVDAGVTLTWKPAVGIDGKIYMVATSNHLDATAIANASSTTQSQSYHPFAYIIYDGSTSTYYTPIHESSGKPNKTWVSDTKLNLESIAASPGLAVLKIN